METPLKKSTTEDFEEALARTETEHYVLHLYVAGATARSARAIAAIRQICEENLQGNYELDVVDIYQRPVLAAGEQIIAAPTLVRQLPLPLRRLIGDMSDLDRVLVGLDISPRK